MTTLTDKDYENAARVQSALNGMGLHLNIDGLRGLPSETAAMLAVCREIFGQPQAQKAKRVPVQIATDNGDGLWIVANDGSLWMARFDKPSKWDRIPDLPQEGE